MQSTFFCCYRLVFAKPIFLIRRVYIENYIGWSDFILVFVKILLGRTPRPPFHRLTI